VETDVRIDKWLWAARFFKTRALATEAINGGKVHMNGVKVKPSRAVKIDAVLEITRGQMHQVVVVKALSNKRGPAKIAQTLYEETEESIAKREAHAEMMKNAPVVSRAAGKPNKKDRRDIRKFKGSMFD